MNISKILFCTLFIFNTLSVSNLSAQKEYTDRNSNQTELITEKQQPIKPFSLATDTTEQVDISIFDEKLQKWAYEKAQYNTDCQHSDDPNTVSDSIYKQRLASLPWIMEMPYNSIVKNFIDLYTVKRRQSTERMLGNSKYYFPLFEAILEQKGMPLELKYLPVIESAFNPTAVSSAGAAGLWQFMPATGRAYGLEINSLIDERLDPVKSTYAAVNYLLDLYKIYGDWHLVIAAYNCGPGNVRKAISRSGGKTDYWAMYPYLPAETRGYVPIFIAANYAFEFASEHNLCALIPELPVVTDTIKLYQRIHFHQITSVINIPYSELKILNPQYRQDIIPATADKPYSLCLPINYINAFLTQQDSIYAYRADELVNRRNEVEVEQRTVQSDRRSTLRYHTVRRGQTLSGIAARYGVSVNNLRKWNNIRGSKLRTGQKLKIRK